MRPGDRNNIVRSLRQTAKDIEAQVNIIENGPRPNLLNVGYGWKDNGKHIDLGYGAFELNVMEARGLVSSLLSAIYSLGGNGNSPGQKHEVIEHAFIDALKTGLTHPLKQEQIIQILQMAKEQQGNMISKTKCKDRFLYKIHSRNLTLGVFRESTGGFIGLREKFGSVYLFEEYHWDNGPPYGTVTPEKELLEELSTDIILDVSLGAECSDCNKQCEYVLFPEGPVEKDYGTGHKVMVRGEWKHIEPSNCSEVFPVGISNAALENWLHDMGKKYALES
jgi:hypothetical protein